MENQNNNNNEGNKNNEDFNFYANPYADLDSKEKAENNGNNNDKNKNNFEEKNEVIINSLNNGLKNAILNNVEKSIENENKTYGKNSNENKNDEEKIINNNNDNLENNKTEKKDKIINSLNLDKKGILISNDINDNKVNIDISNNINQNTNNNLNNENSNQNRNDININNKVNRSKTVDKKNKLYTIKETGSHIYIENTKKTKLIAIEKSFNKIYSVKDFSEMLNLNPMKTYQIDSILGIIDISGNNKYLLVVSSSQFIGNILGADIYNILDVDLIQITLFNEIENEKNRISGVKKLFQSKNFYYSNEVDLSSSNIFNKNKNQIISDYCINTFLLKYFFDNLISNEFYSKIIYGDIWVSKKAQK